MKHILLALLAATVFAQPTKFIPKFELKQNNLELTRIAQPQQYFDKIGRKAAIMGFESGNFEIWVWPWKVLNNFELQFFLGNSTQPIRAKDIVRNISVTPEATILTYVYESFTVKEIFIVPHDEQGLIILLDVFTTDPLTIIPGFNPVLQPQWPAGIGGQYSYWHDDIKAYVISESQHRALFFCGSPAAEKMAQPPAHMFAESPLQFRLDLKPGETKNKYVPIVIAGGSNQNQDSVKAIYHNLINNAEIFYDKNFSFYNKLRQSTIQIETPDPDLNLAFEWGKVALNNLLVTNPVLGTGLVAGYGLSGGGGRPGFSWYFGGDAFINSLALTGYGDYETVKQALKFVQKWQRQEDYPIRDGNGQDIGKMAHELSQSEGLIDWWNDYHYGYNHADTTPWYLVAMGNYIRATGDIEFLRASWNSLVQAYKWCLSKDSNHDGLMDLKGAGLGVLEFGKLVKIHNDIYTQGLWTQGLKEMISMAELMEEKTLQDTLQRQFEQAQRSLEKIYWIGDLGYYSFGANEQGEQVREKSIWPASIIMFGLLDNHKSAQSIEAFNAPDVVTDWGIRNLSNESSLYEPKNYNYGTVWPFTSMFMATAQFHCGFDLQGWATLTSTYPHVFEDGLGVMPEVFSGDINIKLAEAYHNQGFSISGFMYPVMAGLVGLKVDAVHKKISFSPEIPANWNELIIKNIRVGNQNIDLAYSDNGDEITLKTRNSGPGSIALEYTHPLLGPSNVSEVSLNGMPLDFKINDQQNSRIVSAEFSMMGEQELVLKAEKNCRIYLLQKNASIGSTNKNIKIISQVYKPGQIKIKASGFTNQVYRLGVINSDRILSCEGAQLSGDRLIIAFEGKQNQTYFSKEIIINTK